MSGLKLFLFVKRLENNSVVESIKTLAIEGTDDSISLNTRITGAYFSVT